MGINKPETLKKYRKKNIKSILEREKKYREKNKKSIAFYQSTRGRELYLKRKYGITHKEYEEILTKQDNRCAICGAYQSDKKHRNLCVDHNHVTGKVRGLLCGKCNTGIGAFQESTQILENTINYLKAHG